MKPEIYAEMHIVFENDYDVSLISSILNTTPYECKAQTDATRISPITNKMLEGYWTIRSDSFKDYDLKVVTDNLIKKINRNIHKIKTICNENQGTVIFDIVAVFDNNNIPAIYFERDFLDIVNELNATIQIDLYVE